MFARGQKFLVESYGKRTGYKTISNLKSKTCAPDIVENESDFGA